MAKTIARTVRSIAAQINECCSYIHSKYQQLQAFRRQVKRRTRPKHWDWIEDFELEHELRFPTRGPRSLLKLRNLQHFLRETEQNWWDFRPPRVPGRPHRVLRINLRDRPIKALLSTELFPPKPVDRTERHYCRKLLLMERPLEISLPADILEEIRALEHLEEEQGLPPHLHCSSGQEDYYSADEE